MNGKRLISASLTLATGALVPPSRAMSASATTSAENTTIAWAKQHLGENFNLGSCLAFVRETWLTAGRNLRSDVNFTWGGNTCPAYVWGHTNSGTTGTGTLPPGALVFFVQDAGDSIADSHVMLSVGGGENISTADVFNDATVHHETLSQAEDSRALKHCVGWWLPDGTANSTATTTTKVTPPTTTSTIYAQTTGSVAHTWTDYCDAGGTQGPEIANNQAVQISCRIEGWTAPDGSNWWYRIASGPWSNGYYVSANAFYNNGAISGGLAGTPFYDPALLVCG